MTLPFHPRSLILLASTALAFSAAIAAPAGAAPTASAVLTCGSEQVTVTGFGRGQVLFVENSTRRFVVTFAALTSGEVLFEAPGQQGKERTVSCTTTSPVTGRTFVFRGFFTPA